MELHFFPFSHFSDRRRITSGIHRTSVDHFDEDEENQKDISDGEFILALNCYVAAVAYLLKLHCRITERRTSSKTTD